VICSCGHHFGPRPELYKDAQAFTDSSGVYLYLLYFNCPRVKENGEPCASTRCIVMFDATADDDEQLEAIAAE